MRPSASIERDSSADVELRVDDERVVIYDVSWNQYVTVREALDHVRGLRMTYRDGILEIMSPGERHEDAKKLIARLVELYAVERDIDLFARGGPTLKKKEKDRALEPDESYSVGKRGKYPDIALEVVVSSGLDKLDVYRGLGVREVWFWREGRFSLFRLGKKGYEPITKSAFLPGLDLSVLASFVNSNKSQPEIVRAFRDWLRKG
jgi:Uma2 family endonuclease